MKKIYSIELLRFIFMLIICLWHFRGVVPSCGHGYLAVEFYFILSGFLLYYSFIGGKYKDAIDYTVQKIKRFYLPFVMMVPVCLVFCHRIWLEKSVVNSINSILIEGLMLHESPMFNAWPLNTPTWYITTLLIAGFLLFSLLQKKIGYELIIVSMIGYGWLTARYETLDLVFMKYAGILLLIRGFCGLSLGAGLAMLIKRLNISSFCLSILNILSVYALFASIYQCFTWSVVQEEQVIFLMAIVVIAVFQPNSLLNRILQYKGFAFSGKLSFYMLLTHYPICKAMEFILRQHTIQDSIILMTLYLVVVILASFVLQISETKIRKAISL